MAGGRTRVATALYVRKLTLTQYWVGHAEHELEPFTNSRIWRSHMLHEATLPALDGAVPNRLTVQDLLHHERQLPRRQPEHHAAQPRRLCRKAAQQLRRGAAAVRQPALRPHPVHLPVCGRSGTSSTVRPSPAGCAHDDSGKHAMPGWTAEMPRRLRRTRSEDSTVCRLEGEAVYLSVG